MGRLRENQTNLVRQHPALNKIGWLRSKLEAAKHPRGKVTIYDAEGRAVATMDPETRQRTPL